MERPGRFGVGQLSGSGAMSRFLLVVWIGCLAGGSGAGAQTADASADAVAPRFYDAKEGLSLEQAIRRAREREPSLRASKTEIDVAQGVRVQAGLRPNPTVSVERRHEPG